MKKILTIIIPLLLASCPLQQTSLPKGEWTVMFYLGDGYDELPLDSDVLELTDTNVNTSSRRVAILYDGGKTGDSKLEILDSPFGLNSRIIDLSDTSIPQQSSNELDMSSKETLKSYINYIKRKAPAENYALFFGSHGTGYTSSSNCALQTEIGSDLDLTDIADTISETGGINLVFFDACLMGSIETVYEFNDSVDYIVASPENIPGNGNEYTGVIKALYSNSTLTPESFGKETIESHYNYYNLNPGYEGIHERKSLQQLYNVKSIAALVESSDFKTRLLDMKTDRGLAGSVTTFNLGYYTDIYDILNTDSKYDSIKSFLNSYITKPDNGIYKWISIYIPSSPSSYNENYGNSKFAQANPDWVTELKTP